jgi:hypothetical protein
LITNQATCSAPLLHITSNSQFVFESHKLFDHHSGVSGDKMTVRNQIHGCSPDYHTFSKYSVRDRRKLAENLEFSCAQETSTSAWRSQRSLARPPTPTGQFNTSAPSALIRRQSLAALAPTTTAARDRPVRMWRRACQGTRSSVFASLPRDGSGNGRSRREALVAPRCQWRNFNASKALPCAEPSDRQPQSSQGAEAMKITRLGMYVNLGMAVTKVGKEFSTTSISKPTR